MAEYIGMATMILPATANSTDEVARSEPRVAANIEELYDEGPRRIAKYVFNPTLETPIRRNLHGDSAGVLGAAGLWSL